MLQEQRVPTYSSPGGETLNGGGLIAGINLEKCFSARDEPTLTSIFNQ